jgi:hypothetical protein
VKVKNNLMKDENKRIKRESNKGSADKKIESIDRVENG